jgi:hypothetical protein
MTDFDCGAIDTPDTRALTKTVLEVNASWQQAV